MKKIFLFVIFANVPRFIICHLFLQWDPPNSAYDSELYKHILNSEKCQRDIQYLKNNTLLLAEFLDAGLRIPKGILMGNTIDFGNYHQCIAINRQLEDIEGKFCVIKIPVNQNFSVNNYKTYYFDPRRLDIGESVKSKLVKYNAMRLAGFRAPHEVNNIIGQKIDEDINVSDIFFRLALCLPKPCTTKEVLNAFLFDIDKLGFQFEDEFCRVSNDKPWLVGDTVAVRHSESSELSHIIFRAVCLFCYIFDLLTRLFSLYAKACFGVYFAFLNIFYSSMSELFLAVNIIRPSKARYDTNSSYYSILLSIIGFIILVSTSYDIWHNVLFKRDCKNSNVVLLSFSAYSNARNVVTFKSTSDSLHCIDGIRALSMIWIIFSHTLSSQVFFMNPIETLEWVTSYKAILVVASTISVDTFFTLSGLLVVYTVAKKLNSLQLLKNLHLFYVNRLLRMFPILALFVLLEATLYNHVADGPFWLPVIGNANRCKSFWWTALLHIQNYLNCYQLCLGTSWYLSVDVQLHILSPIVLFWVLSKKRKVAYFASIFAILASIIAATVYNFIKELPSSSLMPTRSNEVMDYTVFYYTNTLTRAPPFVVGMMFGYLLHSYKGRRILISWVLNVFLWLCSLIGLGVIIYSIYPTLQMDYDNQIADSSINSFIRPAWALFLGWIIIACVHGYGGPVNWFLSLYLWKLPARLSYALYLVHYSLMVIINATRLQPLYFSVGTLILEFMSFFSLSVILAFAATVLVDEPFANLTKLLLNRGKLKTEQIKLANPQPTSSKDNQID